MNPDQMARQALKQAQVNLVAMLNVAGRSFPVVWEDRSEPAWRADGALALPAQWAMDLAARFNQVATVVAGGSNVCIQLP